MLVITGTQRSGTSFTANFFKQCGFDIGSDFWHEDINGGYENIELCLFFRDYLGDPTFPFSDLPVDNPCFRVLSQIDYPVAKFSYLTMLPMLIPIWHKFRGNRDTFLLLERNSYHVVESKGRIQRFGSDSLLLGLSADTIEDNFNLSISLLNKYKMKYKILQFPDFLINFSQFLEAVAALDFEIGTDIVSKKKLFYSLVDPSKIHFGKIDGK